MDNSKTERKILTKKSDKEEERKGRREGKKKSIKRRVDLRNERAKKYRKITKQGNREKNWIKGKTREKDR